MIAARTAVVAAIAVSLVGSAASGCRSNVEGDAEKRPGEAAAKAAHAAAPAGATVTRTTLAPPEPTAEQRREIALAASESPIKSDEEVRLFPSAAWLDEGAGAWHVPVHGWIYEPEEGDLLRDGAVAGLREALEDDPRVQSELFSSRVRTFLVDDERGKEIAVTVAGEVFVLPESGPDGHFRGSLRVRDEVAERWARDGRLELRAITRAGDTRRFATQVHLVPPEGFTILSDIDDTVKVTNVLDKVETLENTFLEPFRPVDNMAETYRGWLAEPQAGHLHFVSSSPWQLFADLAAMLDTAGFPPATFDLKAIRPKSLAAVGDLMADPLATKPPVIEQVLAKYPRRRFALVGDSGEKDPEVYGEVARRHPDRIVYIAIRDVTGEDASAPRYAAAFASVKAPYEIFTDPKTLRGPGPSP